MSRYSKTYELPLSRDYVRHWGMLEGVREILQNAIDSDSPFEYVFGADSLIVRSRNATLDRKSLLLGATSKADCKDKIGSFGEGYKIALLVLTREGYAVTVHNGARTWTPTFKYSRQFEAPVLCIEDMSARRGAEGLAFEIKGLSPSDIEKIRDSCLLMQKEVGEIIETPKGNILVNRGGKLYVGGLYVCDTEMNYGYDVKPEFLRLERDRQTVSGWELKYITKEMWAESGRFDQMAALLEAKAPDVEAAAFGMPEMVKEACYKLFASKHPGAVPVTSQAELNSLVKGTLTVYVSDGYRNGIVGARAYVPPQMIRITPPAEVLQGWLDANRAEISDSAAEQFAQIIAQSAGWYAR